MKTTILPEIVDEAVLGRSAYILGESSAAHLALENARSRRDAGQKVVIVRFGSQLLVVNIT